MFWFIGGTNIQAAIKTVKKLPYQAIYDYAKEASYKHTSAKLLSREINDYSSKIVEDVKHIPPGSGVALKLSSFYNPHNFNRSNEMFKCVYRILHVNNQTPIFLDAEQESLREEEHKIYDTLLWTFNTQNVALYKTYQMYRKDAMNDLVNDLRCNPYQYHGIKLVRGAYMHEDGVKGVLHSNKAATDESYNDAVAHVLSVMNTNRRIKVLIATHNNTSIQLALQLLNKHNRDRVAFAQLLGMNDAASMALLEKQCQVFKYVPYGSIQETLPYLTRRLYENADITKYMM